MNLPNWKNVIRRRRVPVLLQMHRSECGATCLAMLLRYHGRVVPLSECRLDADAGRDGLDLAMLAAAARRHGLRPRALGARGAFRGEALPLPAIAHWEGRHFIVLERWSEQGVDIVDPACGRRRLSPEEFAAGFAGTLLLVEPGPGFERRDSRRFTWRAALCGMLRAPGVRRMAVQILAASLLLQLLGLGLPAITQIVVDRVLPEHSTGLLTLVGIGMVVVVLAQIALNHAREILLIVLETRLDRRSMHAFFEHLLALPFAFFQRRTTGDLLERLGSNMTIREILSGRALSAVLDGTLAITYMAALVAMAPHIGLATLAIGVAQGALLAATNRRTRELTHREVVSEAATQDALVESLAGIGSLKAAGAEHRALERWASLFERQTRATLERGRAVLAVETGLMGLRSLAPVFLLWTGAAAVLDGRMTLGSMLALNALANAALMPLTSLVVTWQQLQLVSVHLERIADVMESEREQTEDGSLAEPKLRGRIEVRDVDYAYDGRGPLALKGVSFAIEAGQKLALVGRSGSGKTTLARMLLGLHQPLRGEILYDEAPLATLKLRALRNQVGVVVQDPSLFAGTLRDNVAFGDPSLEAEDIERALHLAALESEVAAMPLGLETPLAEGATDLSGGQRQRVAIARAVARRPAVLLMDEATSHLDTATERDVHSRLDELECTRIVIAHRLSTVRDADLILVLDGGEIVERGRYTELVQRGGIFAELVREQDAGVIEVVPPSRAA
jgi:ABC-type bacteriocin/lantibiotic exporter with double-glycine peptidase domain